MKRRLARIAAALLGPWVRLRLRTKLTTVLVLAALVPMVLVATIAVGIVLGTLERGLRDQTERQREVGLNLVLRAVERLGDDAVRLAGSGDLARALGGGEASVGELLARLSPQLPSALVQITDAAGAPVGERVVGGDEARFAGLGLDGGAELVKVGRAWGKRVTFDVVGERLVVRAVAPVVDASLVLQGVVVLSVPLDGAFVDGIKGALGSDMLVAARTAARAQSTFRSRDGRRLPGIAVPARIVERVAVGRQVATTDAIDGREYAMAWTALVDHEKRAVGLFGVAVDRRALSRAQRGAFRSLAVGGAAALGFALLLAALMSRRLGEPIARLHRGAVAVARGDLDHRIDVAEGDEIGELARAFSHMTMTLKENQQRLAARMREIVALHDAGRAMSSVIELDQVVRKVVDSVARTFDGHLCALWLREPGGQLTVAASRARRAGMRAHLRGGDAGAAAAALLPLVAEVGDERSPVRLERIGDDPRRGAVARAAGIDGSLVATPLERKDAVVGVIVVGRAVGERPFSEADANLLATFADQAAAAIENARLYAQVVGASEELDRKVRLRTAELTSINRELGKTLVDLRETQSQLILSERLAGLGLLVAGVAHDINSPSAAIRGSVEAMGEVASRLTRHLRALADLELGDARRAELIDWGEARGRRLAGRRLPTGAAVRRAVRLVRARLEEAGIEPAGELARELAEVGMGGDEAGEDVVGFVALVRDGPAKLAPALAGYLVEHAHLHRNVSTIQSAIDRIQRIVGALKTYSHLDQQATMVDADLHDGIETTLVILDYALRGITVSRSYGELPRVPVYVDELNQVWTNLIQNAVHALQGQGMIAIETAAEPREAPDGSGARRGVVVRVIDDGPGIPAEVIPQIFEPFFTTKPKGEGTGLGLGIVKRIVDKHGGEVTATSSPGRTTFSVWLPVPDRVNPEVPA
jgi:two-component system, NtrC family, sensor kinase